MLPLAPPRCSRSSYAPACPASHPGIHGFRRGECKAANTTRQVRLLRSTPRNRYREEERTPTSESENVHRPALSLSSSLRRGYGSARPPNLRREAYPRMRRQGGIVRRRRWATARARSVPRMCEEGRRRVHAVRDLPFVERRRHVTIYFGVAVPEGTGGTILCECMDGRAVVRFDNGHTLKVDHPHLDLTPAPAERQSPILPADEGGGSA